jgi:hypothetical protein
MQHVHVRQAGERRFEPVEQVARLDERQIERLAVVGDDRTGFTSELGHRAQHRALDYRVRHQILPDAERAAVEPGAADQERVGAGAAGKAGGLEIHEQQPIAARGAGQQIERGPGAVGRRQPVGDRHMAVTMARRILPLDHHETMAFRILPGAAEYLGRIGGITRRVVGVRRT